MPFSTRITVPFGDTDPAGFVYYPNLFHYCHIAMERFFAEACGVPYSDLITKNHLGFPTVNIESTFREPFVYGDEIEIRVSVSGTGRTSTTFNYRLFRTSNMVQCAEATMVHVAMDLNTRLSVAIPDDVRLAFLRY